MNEREFNLTHLEFAFDPRTICLGFTKDGFNPFGTMNTSYNIWHVALMNYNLSL